jgi:hypothetical protein
MTCKELTDRVMAFRDGELPLGVRLSLQLHAAFCPCCRTLLDTYDTTVHLSGELAATEVPDAVAREFDRMIETAMDTPLEPLH